MNVRRKVVQLGISFTLIFVFSFLFNYLWESLHAVYLYKDHNFYARRYISMVSYASAVDSALILLIYLMVSCLWRDMFWIRKMNGKQVFTAFMAGVLIAAEIEYRQANVLKVWSYAPLMPTIGGIGISPLFQLGSTGLLAFWLTRRLTCHKGYSTEESE